MTKFELQHRTKKFHVDVLIFCSGFPKNTVDFETAKQLIRAAGSVGANYRAACRAKSEADFIYKIEVVLEEADEFLYWLEITQNAKIFISDQVPHLIREANELVSIFNAADRTAKKNRDAKNPNITKSPNQK